MNSKYRYLVPNGITFLSLTCGVISIFLSASGNFLWAGILIMSSYILDALDGTAARKLKAGSEFGLQLDSLVDMVSLGMAPATLTFLYLSSLNFEPAWTLWVAAVMMPLGGAFRLARFNLLPAKQGQQESMGLTISFAGVILAVAVLANVSTGTEIVPIWFYVPMLIIVSALMVSTIRFLSFGQVVGQGRISYVIVALFCVSLIFFKVVLTCLIFGAGYLGVSLAWASYNHWR